jgi:hypothetical protein
MTEKFLAIAPIGKEFLHKKTDMIAVPTASAEKIKNVLNQQKYKIKDGETWHTYDNDYMSNMMIDYEIKRYGNRMKVYRYMDY